MISIYEFGKLVIDDYLGFGYWNFIGDEC